MTVFRTRAWSGGRRRETVAFTQTRASASGYAPRQPDTVTLPSAQALRRPFTR